MQRLVLLVAFDVLVIALCSIVVGVIAPRVPSRWLDRDRGPLHLWSWETPTLYRRLGARWLAATLPEAGALFGGESKSALPGMRADALVAYAREVRRAEWVHWLSAASALLTFAFNPWWLALAFTIVVAGVNGVFIVVLRNNRLRIRRILDRSST